MNNKGHGYDPGGFAIIIFNFLLGLFLLPIFISFVLIFILHYFGFLLSYSKLHITFYGSLFGYLFYFLIFAYDKYLRRNE